PGSGPPPRRLTLCYGTRSAEYLAGLDDFRRLGVEVRVSTDDGSAGQQGFVTELLRRLLDQSGLASGGSSDSALRLPTSALHIACCGPEPMMAAVAGIAGDYGV